MVFEKIREKLKKHAEDRHERLLKQDKAKIEDIKKQEKLWQSAEEVEKERTKVYNIKHRIDKSRAKTGGGGFLGKLAKTAQGIGKGFDEVGKAIEPIGRGLDNASGAFGLPPMGGAPRRPKSSGRKHKRQKSKKKGKSRRRAVDPFDFRF